MTPSPKRRWRISRRSFLISTGVLGTGLALGYGFGLPAARLRIAETLEAGGGQPSRIEATPTAWFEIKADNSVTFYAPKVEMGQGVHTSLAQIAVEELEIDWAQLRVLQSTTSRGPYDSGGTSGSNSVASLYKPIREMAATMREMLRTEAARQRAVQPSDLSIAKGFIALTSDPNRKLSYGEIVKNAGPWQIPKEAPALKARAQFHTIGKPLPRVDFLDKLTGKAVYGYDARLPNMLYGAIARPPTIAATLRSAAVGEADKQPGVVDVIAERDFAAVIGESRAAAYAGLNAMQLEWNTGKLWQQSEIEDMITVGKGSGVLIQTQGNAEAQLNAAQVLTAEFRTPMAAHAHLEAQAALADVRADSATIWVSTQFTELVRQEVTRILGFQASSIEVIPTFLGGGFGRKSGIEPAVEAARLSQAVGRPVHVGWSRSEDFRHGYVRPPTHHRLRARLNGGRIDAIEHEQASGHVAFDFLPGALTGIMGADFGAWRGAILHYAAPHIRTMAWRTKLPVRTGWWRGLGLLANTFAIESFIDELAHNAGIDALQFRLDNLPDDENGQRLRAVLQQVAQRSNWGAPLPAGHARGLACCIDARTVVAQVAEISLEGPQSKDIRVHRVSAAIDPGLVINPDGAIAQSQGAIVMGLGSTLLEELTIKDGQFSSSNFDSYPIMTMRRTPQIDIDLLESGEIPFGMGEPPIGPVAAAVANAVFALTGQRLRSLPLRLGA